MSTFLVYIQTGSSLIVEKALINSRNQRIDGGYGEYSDIITIRTKVTNWGETDAAPCVLTDTLWDGLTFISGTVTGDAGVTGTVTNNNGVITATLGEGATASAGGTLKGSQAMGNSGTTGRGQQAVVEIKVKITGAPGSTVKNQAKVTYKDKGFEVYGPAEGYISYSTVDYEKSSASDLGNTTVTGNFTMNMLNHDGSIRVNYNSVDITNEETYVNQFVIVDRQANGLVWVDRNENGMIDASERMFNGLTVKMQMKNALGVWEDASDWAGNSLVTITDANGYYSFRGMLPGEYRAMVGLSNYRVVQATSSTKPTEVNTPTGSQGEVDNDAVAENGWAVIQTIMKTENAFTPDAHTYYSHNADIALAPSISIIKEAVNTGTSSTIGNGSQDAPEEVMFGDTITYKISLKNESADPIKDPVTITDILPQDLTYISSTTSSQSIAEPTVTGQTVTWVVPQISANGSAWVTITAKVTAPNANIINGASSSEHFGFITESNKTYHQSKGINLEISKTVTGDYGNKTHPFQFVVKVLFADNSQLNQGINLGCVGGIVENSGQANAPIIHNNKLTIDDESKALFTLQHGQKVSISDLPIGAIIEVSEANTHGYSVLYSIDGGTQSETVDNKFIVNMEDKLSRSTNVVNNRLDVVVTGLDLTSNDANLMLIVICVLLGVGVIGVFVMEKMLKHTKVHRRRNKR